MKIAIIGGRLQGVEICYLAQKAGFATLVIDKSGDVPARGICSHFIEFHFSVEDQWPSLPREWHTLDLIFPALEDTTTLHFLSQWAKHLKIPLVFDLPAYQTSQSKAMSNELFQALELPLPRTYPDCPFPVIVKPDRASGSKDIVIVNDESQLKTIQAASSGKLVIQEYLEGPSFSLEVIGSPGRYATLQTTDLYMDKDFDCCGVSAPTILDKDLEQRLREMITAIAGELFLTGIMDLEVILHENRLNILEIDARFPSQTPITVYLSTGVNMVAMLADLFSAPNRSPAPSGASAGHALLEHIRVTHGKMEICGEHIISDYGRLRLTADFFGADEALTTYDPAQEQWVATIMFRADSRENLEKKRSLCHQRIASAADEDKRTKDHDQVNRS